MRFISRSARVALAVAALALVAPSCRVRHEVGLDMRPDGSGTFSLATGLDGAARRVAGADAARALSASASADVPAPPGAHAEAWTADGFEGTRVVVPFATLEALEALFDGSGEAAPLVTAERQGERLAVEFDAPRFAALTVAPALDELRADAALTDAALTDAALTDPPAGEGFEVRLRVRLPGRVLEHNAHHVEADGSLVWRLHPAPADPARATTSLAQPPAPGPRVALAAVLVALVVWATTVRRRRRRHPQH